jgi:hypothetical protein
MAMAAETEFKRLFREAKEQASGPIDYNMILIWQYGSALASMGTPLGRGEIRRLEVAFHPWLDERYYRKLEELAALREKFISDRNPVAWDRKCDFLWLEALTDAMKRKGFLPMGVV